MEYNRTNLQLVGSTAIVEIETPVDSLVQGILIAGHTSKDDLQGKVKIAGPTCPASLDDVVLLSNIEPIFINFEGKKCRFVKAVEILAIVKKAEVL